MARTKRYKYSDVIEALETAQGWVSRAADILGCSQTTVHNYINKSADVKEALQAIRDRRHDFVESALMKNIQAGNIAAQIFYLKTQAKHRGWIERQELVGVEDMPIPITVVKVNRGSD